MFRKSKIKANLRKKTLEDDFNANSIEDEQKEIESRIRDIQEAQRVRQRRNGMDAVECAVGRELAKEFARLDEDPFKMSGGAMLRLTDTQRAALNAADIEADIKEQFKKETLLRDEHEEMRRYVEARLKRQNTSDDATEESSKRAKHLSQEEEIFFKAAERVQSFSSKRKEELLSNQMLVGIPEVDLGIEVRMSNIVATEQKKAELLKKGIIPRPIADSWKT
uniref:Nefa_Nip30_N domain-containing protein n=1 Tax=Meloidogyne hapla TaxID=6305 RepID=A0A1I8B8R5_MELHA